ncbi:hypothetical protein CBL_20268, partial [Carabus blaptoides fortunei]
MVFMDFSSKEELVTVIPLEGTTRGQDIFDVFKKFIKNISLPLYKLVSITTDGAPAMTGCRKGFITLSTVMLIAFKISNSIRAKSLQRKLFKLYMEESNHEGCTEPLMHTDVRWLSRGKFLQRFHDLIDEIKQFLITRGDNYKILEDDSVLEVLAILWALSCGIRHHQTFKK